jgi:hypothetical protein
MKTRNIKTYVLVLVLALAAQMAYGANAYSKTEFELTITNGSQMPISPAAVYVKSGAESAAPIGSLATAGFVQLCQTGNAAARVAELKSDMSVSFSQQSAGPIMPGESRSVIVEVSDLEKQSIHFEAMYGKTKDVCAVGTANSHSLVALKKHVTQEIVQKDDVVSTGVFNDPALSNGMSYIDANTCMHATNAISCLREIATPLAMQGRVKFFAGYLPSLVTALEGKYGASDVQTLIIPASGGVQFKLKLKH